MIRSPPAPTLVVEESLMVEELSDRVVALEAQVSDILERAKEAAGVMERMEALLAEYLAPKV